MNRLFFVGVGFSLLVLAGCSQQEDAETLTSAPPPSADAKTLPPRVGGKPILGDPSTGSVASSQEAASKKVQPAPGN